MKKLIIILLLFVSWNVFSQTKNTIRQDSIDHIAKGNKTKLYHNEDSNRYEFETNKNTFNFNKDITVNGAGIKSTDSSFVKIDVEYIDFDTTQGFLPGKRGRIFYYEPYEAWIKYLNDSVWIIEDQYMPFLGENKTSTTLVKGTVLWVDSCSTCSYPAFRRSIADNIGIASATEAVALNDIPPGEKGIGVKLGSVDMDLTGFSQGDVLYSSPYDSGLVISGQPPSPFYTIMVGRVVTPGSNGVLSVRVQSFIGNDTEVALNGILNGIIINKQSLRDTIISNILYFETDNEDVDTLDLPFMYQNLIYKLNTTSGVGKGGRAQVSLTYGTDTSARTNYIYIDNSGVSPVLAANTTGFDIDNTRLAECGVMSQSLHQSYGFPYFQRFNNAVNNSTTKGWISRLAQRIRLSGSVYDAPGIDPTVTIITNGTGLDTLKVSMTSGTIWQFNEQTYQSQDGNLYLWLNSPTGLRWIQSLSEIDSTEGGIHLHGGNNRRYGLNLFNIQNSGDFNDFIAVTGPINYYSLDESAIDDVNGYAVRSVPNQFVKTTTRHSRIVVNYSTVSSGTITNLLGAGGYQDERGQPIGSGGGGTGGESIVNFSDADITIYSNADPSKKIDFDASAITTGNTRTITMPDKDVTLIGIEDVKDSVHVSSTVDTLKFGAKNISYINSVNEYVNQDVNEDVGLYWYGNASNVYSFLYAGGNAGAQDASFGAHSNSGNGRLSFIEDGNTWTLQNDILHSETDTVAMESDLPQNLTDSTLLLTNSIGDSIKLQLDTAFFDSTRVKVKELRIGGGDVLTTSNQKNFVSTPLMTYELDSMSVAKVNSKNDSLILNQKVKFNNDTILFENFNRIHGVDSSYQTDKNWTWTRNID